MRQVAMSKRDVDSKWKLLATPVPGYRDLRQIFAYDVMWDAADGYLLYPKLDGSENTGGAFQSIVNGSQRRCGVAFSEVDPGMWKKDSLLEYLGYGAGNG